jgi:hypothetical protein
MSVGTGASFRGFWARHRVDCLLVVAVVLILGPIVGRWHSQPASRMALTHALAEHGTVDVAGSPLSVDYSVVDGHELRSDKAPGQPALAVPVYLVERAIGAESYSVFRPEANLTVWWVTFWSATVPLAILVVLLRRHAARYAPRLALPVTLAFVASTMLLPYAVNLYGHVLAATLVFGAWMLLDGERFASARLVGAGALLGLAVFVEYEAAVFAVVFAGYVLWRNRRVVPWLLLGAAPLMVAFAMYHWRAFGAPWTLPYSSYVGRLEGKMDVGMREPVRSSIEILFSPLRGLILTSPLVIVAFVAAFLTARDGSSRTASTARVALVGFGGVLVIVAMFEGADLAEVPGPRFLMVGLPLLVTPLAVAWKRVAPFARPAVAWGVLMNVLATWTIVFVGHNTPLWDVYPDRLAERQLNPTVWSIALGPLGIVLYLATITAVVWALAGAVRQPVGEPPALVPA